MRIDLHCHTKKIKKGDASTRNVTPDLFRTKIELADVKIVAITNHNAFDLNQYKLLKEKVKDICQVWPGVEIDIDGETKFHLIVITRAEDADRFAEAVEQLFKGANLNDCFHTLEETCSAFSDFDSIFIPHYHDKRPAISDVDKEKLLKLVGDSSRVFIEPRNHRTLGVLANKDMNVLIGSDVQDWNRYEDSTFAELRLPIGSFAEFLLLAKRDKNVVETLLNKKMPIKLVGKPHPKVGLPLCIYPDVNILFGQKGTGKTEILKSLYSEMLGSGKNCKKYIASENAEDFSAFTNIKDMEADLGKVGAASCEDEFRQLNVWVDCNPTLFSNFLDWLRTKGNSNNKNRMKITEAVHDVFSIDDKFDSHQADIETITRVVDEVYGLKLEEYLDEKEIKFFRELIEKLISSVYSKREKDIIAQLASKLTNFSIDKIKALADQNSDTISRPSTAGLVAFAQGRIRLLHTINVILKNLAVSEHNERVKLGTLENKGDIFVNYKYRMVCQEERTANFPGCNITTLRDLKGQLEYMRYHIFDDDIAAQLEKFTTRCSDESISSLRPFLGRSKQIVTSDGCEYSPSNGEKGILLLSHVLQEEADAYFLDEPELGMGNSYIDSNIRPLISDLARRRKYVVVATHNANIAVRTLPYMSIFRTHENGEYKTYIGNPFDDRLVNIDDEDDIKSWTEESMHSLEGGRKAFYERRDIYESKEN